MPKNSSSSKQSADTTTTTTYNTDSSVKVTTGLSGKDLTNIVMAFGNFANANKVGASSTFLDASTPYANAGFNPSSGTAAPAASVFSSLVPIVTVIGGIIAIIYYLKRK